MMNEDNNNETASLAGGSRRCIHFGSVEVLELPMVIGDNPSAIGVPIGIDWWSDDESDATNDDSYDSNEQLQKEDLERIITSPIKRSRRRLRVHAVPSERRNVASMEDYEKEHPVRRTRRQLHWNRRNREEMLLRNGFTEQQIRLAEFEALIVRRSRRESQYDPQEWADDDIEGCCYERDVDEICSTKCYCDGVTGLNDVQYHRHYEEQPSINAITTSDEKNTNIQDERSPVRQNRTCIRDEMSPDRQRRAFTHTLDTAVGRLSPCVDEYPNKSSIWGTGGSPDQPLQVMPRRLSFETCSSSSPQASPGTGNEETYDKGNDETGPGNETAPTASNGTLSTSIRNNIQDSVGHPPLTTANSFDSSRCTSLAPVLPLQCTARTA